MRLELAMSCREIRVEDYMINHAAFDDHAGDHSGAFEQHRASRGASN